MRALLLGLLLVGCADSDDTELPKHPSLLADGEVRSISARLDPTRRFSITLSFDRAPSVSPDGVYGCPQLDESLTARVGSVDLPVVARGGWRPNGADTLACGDAVVSVDVLETEAHELVIADDSEQRTFDLGAALELRTITHPTWTFSVGEIARVGWSHPNDLDVQNAPNWVIDTGQVTERVALETTVNGATVEFEMPSVPGMHILDAQDAIERSCGDACTIYSHWIVPMPITVEP